MNISNIYTTIEGSTTDYCTAGHGKGRQPRAVGKCIGADVGHAIWNHDGCQPRAAAKRTIADAGDTVRDRDGCQPRAPAKSVCRNRRFPSELIVIPPSNRSRTRQPRATFKCPIADAGDTFRNCERRQPRTAVKRKIADAGDTVGNSNRRQPRAIAKRIGTDARQAVRKNDLAE